MISAGRAIRLALVAALLTTIYFVPADSLRLPAFLAEGLLSLRTFVREHLLYALLPALAMAAVISISINKARVIRLMGAGAGRIVAYGVAALSGGILSVCSCSVLPLFAGVRRMGAGLGPATAFLYAGPAINVLAIILTARVLGWQLGLARGVGAVAIGIIIGVIMSLLFGRGEELHAAAALAQPDEEASPPLRRVAAVLAAMVAITVFLTWSPGGFRGMLRCCPGGLTASAIDGRLVDQTGQSIVYRDGNGSLQTVDARLVEDVQADSLVSRRIYQNRLVLAAIAAGVLATMIVVWFRRGDLAQWGSEGMFLGRKILLPLLAGVFLSGMLLGSPGRAGLIPHDWLSSAVSGNSVRANFLAAVAGAFMYFATLTEVPIVQGLMNSGLGHGPALAMLLSGPAVSLPSVLVLGSLMGWRKTTAYLALVIVTATLAGLAFGMIAE